MKVVIVTVVIVTLLVTVVTVGIVTVVIVTVVILTVVTVTVIIVMVAVLPSRSALSDLGLIADLFEKMLLNWSSFCLKSPKKSDFYFFFSLPHKAKHYLIIPLNINYFPLKADLTYVGIKLVEQV